MTNPGSSRAPGKSQELTHIFTPASSLTHIFTPSWSEGGIETVTTGALGCRAPLLPVSALHGEVAARHKRPVTAGPASGWEAQVLPTWGTGQLSSQGAERRLQNQTREGCPCTD